MARGSDKQDANGVASVVKALAIIEHVGERGPTSLAELVAHSGLPKSTVFRLLSTICNAGFLERTARGEYAPTIKCWRIGAKAIDYAAIYPQISASLHSLVDQSTETAHYSIYDDGYAVYVEKVEGLHPIRAYTHVGGRSPSYASATGKALLAYQATEEIERVARQAKAHTPATVISPARLLKEMAAVREQGYAVNRGEWRDGVWGVAAGVFDHRGAVVGAIGVSGPQDRAEPALDRLTKLVLEHAHSLTERQGGMLARASA